MTAVAPAPQTHEFQAFQRNIEYARQMVTAGHHLAPFRSPVIDVDDFYRAAWVQAVSAIDHWFHEELYRRVAELTAKDSPAMPHQLTKFELPLSKVEEVRSGTIDLSDAVSEHVRTKWSGTSLQNPRRISEALRLVSTEDIWAKSAAQINAWNHHRTSFTSQTLKQRYITITDRRNKIAHEADLLDGDLKRRRPISEEDAKDAINWIERIARAIAAALG